MEIGSLIKVGLPGETPWAEVVSIVDAKSFIGRIDNKLFREYSEIEKARFLSDNFGTVKSLPELHKYKKDDLVLFSWSDEEGRFLSKEKVKHQ